MKTRFAAVAAALAAASVGCTSMGPGCGSSCGPMGCGAGGCHVATSQHAPRPTIFGRRSVGHGLADRMGWTQKGCNECLQGGHGAGPFGTGGPCQACGGAGCNHCLQQGLGMLLDCQGACNSSGDENYNFNPGPPVGQVAYPYYTTRGPRDFLMCNPPSIGPR